MCAHQGADPQVRPYKKYPFDGNLVLSAHPKVKFMTNQVVPLNIASPEPYVSVIIPVYNEEESLRELGERLRVTRPSSRVGRLRPRATGVLEE